MADRRYSLAAPTQTPNGSGRYSLAGGRPSLGASRIRNGANINNMASEFSGINISEGRTLRLSMDKRDVTSRRSSGFSKTLPPTFAGGKDPRPIREKSYQLETIKNLIEYLAGSNYNQPISQKILTAPSAKDFQNIFKFLYSRIDPGYEIGKKFEEEVPILMKGLRYPFAGDISKSQLYAVGSMHAWPGLLAMLGWMVELINCCDSMQNLDSVMLSTGEGGGGVNEEVKESERLFFDFLCKGYKLFLSGEDNIDPLIEELGASLEERNAALFAQVDGLACAVTEKEGELQTLTSIESPLSKAKREYLNYKSDIEKFNRFIKHLEIKRTKYAETIKSISEELQTCESDLRNLEEQRASLQAQVEAQDICPEDVDKMYAEKDLLTRTLESHQQTREEASKLFWERELLIQKKLDLVEKLVQDYNFLAEQCSIIPVEAVSSAGKSWELAFNPHSTTAEQLVSLDLENAVSPFMETLREQMFEALRSAQDQLLSLHESLDKISENCNDKLEELRQVEKKIERLVSGYTEEKKAFLDENKRMEEEAEKLEATIHKIKSDTASQDIHSQQRLQRITVDYDQLVAKVAREKESAGSELYQVLEELLNFKTNMESSLRELEAQLMKEEY